MAGLLQRTVLALVSLALAGLVWAQGYHPGNAVRINGDEISNQRFNAYYTEYRKNKGVAVGARGDQLGLMKQLRREAMELLIEQELVRQAAVKQGIEVDSEEVDKAVGGLRDLFDTQGAYETRLENEGFDAKSYHQHIEDMLKAKRYLDDIRMIAADVSDEELEKYYLDNEYRLTLPEEVRVRHILLSWKPLGKPDDRAALREQMNPILEKARSGEDFAELASEYSEDSTRVDGGDVGFFRRGQMMLAFEKAAFSLQPGEISDIVETTYGLHIIKLEERKEVRLLPLDEIRETLRDHIRDENMEKAVQQEYARLREQAEIDILIPLGKGEND